MPPDEDPDTFLERFGAESFAKAVGQARPVLEFFFRDLCRLHEIGSVEGKVAILSEMAPRLGKIADQVERDLYIREIARVLAIEESDVRRKMGRTAVPFSPGKERVKRVVGAEEMLLSLMGKYTEIVRLVAEFGPERIFSPSLLPIALDIVSRVVAGAAIDWSEILDRVVSGEERSRLAALLVEEDHLEEMDVRKAFDQCCQALEKISLKEIRGLRMKLAQTDPDSDEFQVLLKRIDSLRARKSRMT